MDQHSLSEVIRAYAMSLIPQNEANFSDKVGLQGELGWFSAMCFLLAGPIEPYSINVSDFVFKSAPILLSQLMSTSKSHRILSQSSVQGKVDWVATIKARRETPLTFVCIQNRWRYNLPENQFLKLLLHNLQQCLIHVPSSVQFWELLGKTSLSPAAIIGDYFNTLLRQVNNLLKHASIRDINLPNKLTIEHWNATLYSSNRYYREIAQLYTFYQEALLQPRWEVWTKVLRQTLPVPPVTGTNPNP